MSKYKVAIFGAGFVGIPTATVLALQNPEIQFVVFDINKHRIQKCKQGQPPIYEPGLEEILQKTIKSNLGFTTEISEALNGASVIFLALPTPTKNFGQQKGKAYDLSYTQVGIRNIVNYYNQKPFKDEVIIVQKSTVPIGTYKTLTGIIEAISIESHAKKYVVASNPEFLAEGTAVADLLNPDRVILGSISGSNIDKLFNLYSYVPKQKIILMNNSSAELSKLAANCFLAQRVSSINSIAILCEEYDSDINEVKKCIAADVRIGDKFLNSSVGFGGSCFKKDILALIYLAECKGLTEVADYWSQVIEMNEFRKKKFFLRVYNELNNNLVNKKIAIFGTAFKKDTNDPRESAAIEICHYLLLEGAILHLHDPKTTVESFIEEIKLHEIWKQEFRSRLISFEDAQNAVVGTSAILVVTEWDIFKTYDYQSFYKKMQKPCHIFDGRNLLQKEIISEIGFKYHRIGKRFSQPI